jgi:hypothetical protein
MQNAFTSCAQTRELCLRPNDDGDHSRNDVPDPDGNGRSMSIGGRRETSPGKLHDSCVIKPSSTNEGPELQCGNMSRRTKAFIFIMLAAVITVAVLIWRREQPVEQQTSATPEVGPAEPAPVSELKQPIESSSANARVDALSANLAHEKAARAKAEAEAAALRAKLAPFESNVVVSLGKVEDIGKRSGQFLPALLEMETLSGKDPSTLTPDEKRRLLQLQRDHAQLLGALPQIAAFQDNPDEYGRFFSSMFQQAAGLNDQQTAQVQEFMRQRGVMMNQSGLNAAKEPSDPKLEEEWEERRDKFNEETANGLKGILPPDAAEKINFGPELMEFLEMDFDKITPKPLSQ